MAVSIEQLRDFTQQLGLEFESGTSDGQPVLAIVVPTNTPKGERSVPVVVRSYDDGQMFEAVMMGFLPKDLVENSEHKTRFLFYLLHKAWHTKFGTPEVNEDGEVRLLVEVPLIDAPMTLKQFEHILRVATLTAVQIGAEGSQILMHGEMPEDEDVGDKMRQAMVMMVEMVGTDEGHANLAEIAANENVPDVLRLAARRLMAVSREASGPYSVPDSL